MAVDFNTLVYLPNYDLFARLVVVVPIFSQPGKLPYTARGIYDTREIDVVLLDGSIASEQRTILDIRESEFAILPAQGDQIAIPGEGTLPEQGTFEITDRSTNGGGETTLTLQKYEPPRPQ